MEAYLSAIVQGLCFAALAAGIYLSLRILKLPDITTDGTFTLGGAMAAVMLQQHCAIWVILPAVMLAGAVAGACTGIIHTVLKVHVLLSGIIVMTALYSINLLFMGRTNIPIDREFFMSEVFGAPFTILTMTIYVASLISMLYILLRSDYGLVLRGLGNNAPMLRANGVNTKLSSVIGLCLSNALTSLSGAMIAMHQQFADISMGIGIVIVGLGSVIIGESLFGWINRKSIIMPLLAIVGGAITFRLLIAFVLSCDVNPNYLRLIIALVVLMVVAINYKNQDGHD